MNAFEISSSPASPVFTGFIASSTIIALVLTYGFPTRIRLSSPYTFFDRTPLVSVLP